MHLIIHSGTRYFEEEYGEKCLIRDSVQKYKEVLSEIKSKIKAINGGKELFYEKDYASIGVNTNNDVPLNKLQKFPMLIIIIRGIFQNDEKLDPLIYLDECLYESVLE